jgi:cation:H+ antiporter
MNAALILGIAALIQPIVCERQTIRREVPIMIGSALLLWFFAYTDQIITFNEGLITLVLFFIYIYLSYRWSKEEPQVSQEVKEVVEQETSDVLPSTATNFALIAGGLVGLVLGSESLVRGATEIARSVGVSDEVIGLTLIAIGTSLPELATSIVAARKGHSEITLGNVVGSNIFNVFGIVGCASVVSAFNGIPGSDVLNVSPNMLGIHIPLMVVVSLSVLPIMSTGLKIIRAEGALLVSFYLFYNVVLFQSSAKVVPPENPIPAPTVSAPIKPVQASATAPLPIEQKAPGAAPVKAD